MLFTIITICCNEEKRIASTLESIYNQTFFDYEHIIEDGVSTDNTINIVEEYKNRNNDLSIRVYSEKDNGLYDAMNKAIGRANGEYICFINSGDYLFSENTLEKVAEQIKMAPNMDWYYGEAVVIFPNGMENMQIPVTIENTQGTNMKDYLISNTLGLIHQSIFAKRDCCIKHSFDTKYKLRAELKWYYECLFSNLTVKKMRFPVCKYSVGGLSERISSVNINSDETKSIFDEFNLSQYLDAPSRDNYTLNYKNIYSEWLTLKQAGLNVADYLYKNGFYKIAIYGYGELGCSLINELKGSVIEIACIIDKKTKYPYSGIDVVLPERFDMNVDLVIVTALTHYNSICSQMKSITKSKICSLENILEDMW